MKTWIASGAWKADGSEGSMRVQAATQREAETIAANRGLLVETVAPEQATPAVQYAAPVVVPDQKSVSGLGIAGLVLGILACITAWIPFVGLLSLPLSGIGLLLAGIGLLIALSAKRQSASMAVAGMIVCAVAIGIALTMTVLPAAAGANAVVKAAEKQQAERTAAEAAARQQPSPTSAQPAANTIAPAEPAAPVESNFLVRDESGWFVVDEVRFRPVKSWINRAPVLNRIRDSQSVSEDVLFVLEVEIQNTSSTKRATYQTWRGRPVSFEKDYATATDEHGNAYRRINFSFSLEPIGATKEDVTVIDPGQTIRDRLYFEQPIFAAKEFKIELPAKNLNSTDKRSAIVIANIDKVSRETIPTKN